MMRVILDARCATEHFPGIGRYVVQLARGLQTIAPDLDLHLLADASASGKLDLPALPQIDCRAAPFSIQQQWRVPRVLHRARATVYHSPYYLMPYAPGVPTVFTCYDFIPLVFPADYTAFQRRVYRWTHRLALRAARGVLAISETTRADLEKFFAARARHIRVTHLAVDARWRAPSRADIESARQKYALPENYVLYVGSNKPHKNLPLLVRAFARAQNPARAALVIAGAWDARYPNARVIAEEIGARVVFLGAIAEADLPALYGGAILFVFPSLYEGFGLPPLEAMACGAPVICSNASSLPEVVGDAALMFDPRDVDALAAQITRGLNDSALRDELRAKSRVRAAQFSWERCARATLAFYQVVCQ